MRGVCGWAYVAGFFDGEGHLRSTGLGKYFVLTQSSRRVLDEIAEFLREHEIRSAIYEAKHSNPKWSPSVFHLYVTRTPDIIRIIENIRPWLIVKKQVAEDMWRHAKLFPPLVKGVRTHCKHGHPLSGDNLVKNRKYNTCLTCKRESGKRARIRRAS